MDSSDEEVLLFSLKRSPGANEKKKKKKTGVREIFKKIPKSTIISRVYAPAI